MAAGSRGSGVRGRGCGGAERPLCPQDPLSALERDLALQLQIAKAAHRLCREENISKQLRRRRKTAALKEEKKLKELENTLSQCRLLAGHRPLPASGSGGAQGEAGGASVKGGSGTDSFVWSPMHRPCCVHPAVLPLGAPQPLSPLAACWHPVPRGHAPLSAPQSPTPNAPRYAFPHGCTPKPRP